jgi:DNA processing protein
MDERRSCQTLADWLVLVRTAGLSPVKLQQLLEQFGSPGDILNADKRDLAACGIKPAVLAQIGHSDQKMIEQDLVWLEATDNHFVSYPDPYYPALLKQIPDPPIGLFVRGNLSVMNTIQIAIVGSRQPTPAGRRIAQEFARGLAAYGMTVTSGLASGIDSAAHLGALSVNAATIAVLGSGVDVVYPAANHALAEQICETGALISEFPLRSKPLPVNFPRRNRIISGLATGTLVVEAALKSGSLITARLAMEQSREVFAVPGSIHNPLARGCHALLREGAKLTESIQDILEETGRLASVVTQPDPNTLSENIFHETLDEHGKLLLHNIGYEPVTMDFLIEETAIPANVTAALLLNLELHDLIESLPGGSYVRKNRGSPI